MKPALRKLLGSTPFAQRLRWSAPTGAVLDPTADRAVMARAGVYLFGAGATLALVWLALPHSLETNGTGIVATAAAAYVAALVALVGFDRLPPWTFQLIAACGTGFITLAVHFTGEPSSAYALFYIWIALYALYFFTRTEAALHVLLIGLAYAWVLMVEHATDAPADDLLVAVEEAVARWTLTVGTLVVAVGLFGLLKDRLEQLVARLVDVARTDTLTGLLNRRGFEEAFELEVERARRSGRPLAVLVGDLDHFKRINDRFGHLAGDRALERVSAVLRGTKRRIDTAARIGGEEFAVILPDGDEHAGYALAERLRRAVRDAFSEDPVELTLSFGVAAFPKDGQAPEGLLRAGDEALYAAKELGRDCTVIYSPDTAGILAGEAGSGEARRERRVASVVVLAETIDSAGHARSVGRYCKLIARELGLPSGTVERVHLAGVLHDVGKVGVPDSVLQKPGPLDEEEEAEIRRHPKLGARILEGAGLDDVGAWVLAHHERPDGLGYPLGLAGEEIVIEARILAVADAYEAMTTDRVYRPSLGHKAARRELRLCAGTQFDETVVDAFLRVLEREHAPV